MPTTSATPPYMYDAPHPNATLLKGFALVDQGLAEQKMTAIIVVHQFILAVNPVGLASAGAAPTPITRLSPVLDRLVKAAANLVDLPRDWMASLTSLFPPEVHNWWPYSPTYAMNGSALCVVKAPSRFMLVLCVLEFAGFDKPADVPEGLALGITATAMEGEVNAIRQLDDIDPRISALRLSAPMRVELERLIAARPSTV